MTVACLTFDDEVGPEGHSDGDVVAHAVCDALLSAAGLGDLGSNYGTTDPEWSGAPGAAFLTETAASRTRGRLCHSQHCGPTDRQSAQARPRRAEAERSMSEAVGAPCQSLRDHHRRPWADRPW